MIRAKIQVAQAGEIGEHVGGEGGELIAPES